MSDFDALERRVHACTRCTLSQKRTKAVPGEGSRSADIVFVGEGPGFHEDQQGRPFVGPAGRLLDELLASVGLDRKDVYITNMIKCRPPNNRDPLPGEIEACKPYLDEQIEMIAPKVVVALGALLLLEILPGRAHRKGPRKAEAVERAHRLPDVPPGGRPPQRKSPHGPRKGLPEPAPAPREGPALFASPGGRPVRTAQPPIVRPSTRPRSVTPAPGRAPYPDWKDCNV